MSGYNAACEYFLDDGDCRKCYLLGYRMNCGSKECLEARKREEENNVRAANKKRMVQHD